MAVVVAVGCSACRRPCSLGDEDESVCGSHGVRLFSMNGFMPFLVSLFL